MPQPNRTSLVKLAAIIALLMATSVGWAACDEPQEPQAIAVPSYFDSGPQWTQMEQSYPTVQMAVVNPSSGPGVTKDAAYADQVTQSQAEGLTVLGYVYTGYGSRDAGDVKADIDRYYLWYGVDGIFVDEGSTDCAYASSYYAELHEHVKGKGGKAVTALNPGVQTNECYMSVADTIVNFEGTYEMYVSNYSAPEWVSKYPPNRFWHLVYATPNTQTMEEAVRLSKQRVAGWVYVTPATMPNPWGTLPPDSYWSQELLAVQSDSQNS